MRPFFAEGESWMMLLPGFSADISTCMLATTVATVLDARTPKYKQNTNRTKSCPKGVGSQTHPRDWSSSMGQELVFGVLNGMEKTNQEIPIGPTSRHGPTMPGPSAIFLRVPAMH